MSILIEQTIREGLARTGGKGHLKVRLSQLLATYNEIKHTGTGMSPNEAINPTEWLAMRRKLYSERLEQYNKYARKTKLPKFLKGQPVYTQTEIMKDKQDPKYIPGGIVTEVLERDTYLVQRNLKYQKYHASQLRA